MDDQHFKGTTFVPCPDMHGGYVTKKARKVYKKQMRALMESDRKTFHFCKTIIAENKWWKLSERQVNELVEAFPQYFRVDRSNRHPKVWKFVRHESKLYKIHVQQLS